MKEKIIITTKQGSFFYFTSRNAEKQYFEEIKMNNGGRDYRPLAIHQKVSHHNYANKNLKFISFYAEILTPCILLFFFPNCTTILGLHI